MSKKMPKPSLSLTTRILGILLENKEGVSFDNLNKQIVGIKNEKIKQQLKSLRSERFVRFIIKEDIYKITKRGRQEFGLLLSKESTISILNKNLNSLKSLINLERFSKRIIDRGDLRGFLKLEKRRERLIKEYESLITELASKPKESKFNPI